VPEAVGATRRDLVDPVRTEGRLGSDGGRGRMVAAEELAGMLHLQKGSREHRICLLVLVRVAVLQVPAGMVDEEVESRRDLELPVEARRRGLEPSVVEIVKEDNHGFEPS
jgi:hypothetical protein